MAGRPVAPPGPTAGARPASPRQPPTDPRELLDTPLGRVGLPGATVLRSGRAAARASRRFATCCSTCRAATTTCARCARLGDLAGLEDGEVVSARVDGRRHAGRAVASGAASSERSRCSRTRPGRSRRPGSGGASSSAGCTPGDESSCQRQAQALRPAADARQPRVPARRRDGAAPCRPDRAGLPADGRADRGDACGTPSARRSTAPGKAYPEYLPRALVARARTSPPIGAALEEAHYPTTFERRDAALERLAFDELLALQVGMVSRRQRPRPRTRRPRSPSTDAERRADPRRRSSRRSRTKTRRREVDAHRRPGRRDRRDPRATSRRPTPMLRLLQGDVGSGKTAVAAWALAAAARRRPPGRAARADGPARAPACTTLTDAARAARPAVDAAHRLADGAADGGPRARARSRPGMAPVVVGTHALIQEAVAFADLALVVIDEQHRFGVEQRGRSRPRPADARRTSC